MPRIRFQCPTLLKLNNFSFCRERCATTMKPKSPYDSTKLAIHSFLRPEDNLLSNCGQNSKKTLSFDDIVHFIDEENIVTYVDSDCSITFYPETPTKSRQINPERNYNSRSCEKAEFIPATINLTVLLMSNITLISFWTRTNSGRWFQQLLCHSTTLLIDTLCPISTLNQQLTNLEQTHNRCSLHCKRWTVKGRDCALALHSFKEITYRTDDNETVATVEELSGLWKPGAIDGIPPFLLSCNCI